MNGSGIWHADQAWLGHRAENVLIEVENGLINKVTESAKAPSGAATLRGWTIPGLANVHSHAFQHVLRGAAETGGGDFWEWREQMYRAAEGWTAGSYLQHCRGVFREMLQAGSPVVCAVPTQRGLGHAVRAALAVGARKVRECVLV